MADFEIGTETSLPKPKRGCGFWGATGCLGIAIIGAIGIWWLKSYIDDHLILDPAQAAIVAEEIMPLQLPEGFDYQQAFSTESSKIVWATESISDPTTPIVMMIWEESGDIDENNMLSGFEKNRTQGEDAEYVGKVLIELDGADVELAKSKYEDGRMEYTFVQDANPGITMIIFAGPEDVVTPSWVTQILNP